MITLIWGSVAFSGFYKFNFLLKDLSNRSDIICSRFTLGEATTHE
jgi:hypothetical protein